MPVVRLRALEPPELERGPLAWQVVLPELALLQPEQVQVQVQVQVQRVGAKLES